MIAREPLHVTLRDRVRIRRDDPRLKRYTPMATVLRSAARRP
jgi:hypothetical protein